MRFLKTFLMLTFIALFMYGCPDDNPTSPKDNTTIEEKVVEQKSSEIGPDGGSIKLSDGTEVVIPSGSVSGSAKIVVSKIENDNYFTGSNRVSLDISSDNAINGMTVKFKVKEGLTKEQVGVFRYNPKNAETQFLVEGDVPDFDYDSQSGIITATVTTAKSKNKKEQLSHELLFPRWIAEWDENVEGSVESKIIQMPFYEQPGSSCWATCATMLAKAYTPYTDRKKESEVFEFLKYMQLGRDDGIYSYQFLKTLPKAFHLYSGGAGVETTGYFRLSALKEKIIQEIDNNHPVIISLDYPGVGQHAILVVGYKKKTSGSGTVTYDLVIHNPQGTGSETMYTVHDFDWIFSNKSITTAVQILYSTDAVHPDRTLLTMGLPLSGLVGDISFKVPYKTSSYNILFAENINSSKGYDWRWSGKEFLSIPDTASEFNFNIPIWNSDRSSSKSANIALRVYRKGKKVYELSENLTIPASSSAYWFKRSIPLNEIRQSYDSSEYYFEFELRDGGTYADGFSFFVNIEKGPHPLNGRWLWTFSNTDDACGEDFWPSTMTVTVKATKTSIYFYDEEDEDEIALNFSYKNDDFWISYEGEEEKVYIEGTMDGNDKFTAHIEDHTTKYVEDENGNYTEVPCVSYATIKGTRLK